MEAMGASSLGAYKNQRREPFGRQKESDIFFHNHRLGSSEAVTK
jgi:hypothetical protein